MADFRAANKKFFVDLLSLAMLEEYCWSQPHQGHLDHLLEVEDWEAVEGEWLPELV